MTGTSEFEIELLKEKSYVISVLRELNSRLLGASTYIDKAKILDYYNQIDMIVFAIDKEYEAVRRWGKQGTPNGHHTDTKLI